MSRRLAPLARGLSRFAVAVLVAAAPVVAAADDKPDLELARQQFREGLTQEAAGDWSGALVKMEAVARVKLTHQVQYHVARCKEHLGRLTEALGDYRIAEFEAQKAGATELEEITRAREDLEARIPRLKVKLPKRVAGARVELDGVELGAAQLSAEIPLNPGDHQLGGTFKGKTWNKSFTIKEAEVQEIRFAPPESEDDAAAAPEPEPSSAAPPLPPPSEGPGPWPWIVGGVGIAGLGAAGYFAVQRSDAENELDGTCRGSLCPASVQDAHDRSTSYSLLTNVSLGVGVVGLGVATVWLLSSGGSAPTSPPPADAARALRLTPLVGARGELGVAGTF